MPLASGELIWPAWADPAWPLWTQGPQVAGFNYSTAMRDSGVVCNERTLDHYVAAAQIFIPGDIVPSLGFADTAARQRLIAYLRSATG